MSTIWIRNGLYVILGIMLSPMAQAQFDTPPAMPRWEALPPSGSAPELPELPTPVSRPAPFNRPPVRPTAAAPPSRPAGLSQESTVGLPNNVRNVIDFYGGATSARALAQLPQRPSTGALRPEPARQKPKPFEGTVAGAPPTLSPYFNLFLEEGDEGLPNYHAYVRPVLRQLSTNDANRQQLSSLRRQVQTVSYGESTTKRGGSVPGTGHGTRYFNTAQFYAPIGPTR